MMGVAELEAVPVAVGDLWAEEEAGLSRSPSPLVDSMLPSSSLSPPCN